MQQLVLKNDVDSQIPLLAEYIDMLCDEFCLDPALNFNLNLVLEEAVVNVMQYAYPPGEEHTLTLDVSKQDTQLVFVLKDYGVPFNPLEEAPDVDITLNAEEREIGGLGIFLVQQMMDEVRYERSAEGENVLTMIKNI